MKKHIKKIKRSCFVLAIIILILLYWAWPIKILNDFVAYIYSPRVTKEMDEQFHDFIGHEVVLNESLNIEKGSLRFSKDEGVTFFVNNLSYESISFINDGYGIEVYVYN